MAAVQSVPAVAVPSDDEWLRLPLLALGAVEGTRKRVGLLLRAPSIDSPGATAPSVIVPGAVHRGRNDHMEDDTETAVNVRVGFVAPSGTVR